jgi:hypothetical protein
VNCFTTICPKACPVQGVGGSQPQGWLACCWKQLIVSWYVVRHVLSLWVHSERIKAESRFLFMTSFLFMHILL